MRQLKHLSLLLGLLLLGPSTHAQSVRFQSQAISSRGAGIANATVAVCTQPANTNTQPCSPLATLATSTSTTSGGANPLTADSFGNFFFYATPGRYTVQIYGPAVSGQFVTPDVVLPCDSTAPCTFKNLNTMRIATQFAGADIHAQANAAFADCSNACTVYIPAGTYNSVTTTLSLPVVGNGTAGLIIDPGAVINYTGTGDAILASGTGNPNVNLTITGGGRIVGTSSGTHGIHIIGFNKAQFYNLRVSGFSTGDGWFNEGVNTVDCYGCDFSNNLNGIHNVGKVVNGSNLSANAVHFFGGQVANNTGWGLLEDGTLAGTVGPNNNNTYHMVFESNGLNANPSTSGNIFIQRCDICVISGSYLEELAGHTLTNQILLGDTSSACGGANSCVNKSVVIRDNIIASGGTITNSINCVNCSRATIDSNNEDGIVTNFFNNGALSTNVTYGTNIALSATNQQTGSGSYIFNLNNQTGVLSLVSNIIAVNHLFPSNNAQGLFQSGNDTVVRSATSGNVFLQDQGGNNMFHCTTANCFQDAVILPVGTSGSSRTNQKAETGAADANVLTFTPLAVQGTYRACVVVSVSSATAGVVAWTLSWTDSNGNAQSNIAQDLFQDGTAAPATTFTTSAAGNYHFCRELDVNNAGAAIVVKWVGGGTTAAKMSATVERLL